MKTNLEYPIAWDDGTLENKVTVHVSSQERSTKSELTQDVFCTLYEHIFVPASKFIPLEKQLMQTHKYTTKLFQC